MMDFLCIGSVQQYAKGLARQTQWNLKKQSGDFTGHKKSLRDYVSITKASDLLPDAEERDDKLSAIMTKAQAGGKLSEDEWEYLKEKNPELYQKLREIEREQKNYEEALKRCKTRDEARRLHVSKLGDILTAAKNGDASALFRLNRMTQTMTAFTKSEEYRKLPTEAEQAIERESERQEKREALREEAAAREAEREAAAQSEEKTGGEGEAVSETEAGAEAEAGPGAKPGAGAEAGSGGKVPSRSEMGDGAASRTETRRAVPRAAEGTAAPPPERTGGNAPKDGAAPAVSFGQRAYLNQQGEAARVRSRRRTFDMEA